MPRLSVAPERRLITLRVFVARSQVSFWTIEDIADGVVMTEQALDPRCQISAPDASFIVGHPMPDLELQNFALAVRHLEFKRAVKDVGFLLVVLEHEVPADGGNPAGELDAQPPAGRVDL